LPKDVVLAGSPQLLSNVPLFAARQVLYSTERPGKDPVLLTSALAAYYAETLQSVATFCSSYGVDYLVVDQADYAREYVADGRLFFEPYNEELLAAVDGRGSFALMGIPREHELFRSGDLFVVSCDALEQRQ